MFVISTMYDFLSLLTCVAGICIAIFAVLRLWTYVSHPINHAEHLYIVLLSLAISFWSILPTLSSKMLIHPLWQWLSLLALVGTISWYTVYICNRVIPLLSKYRSLLVTGLVLLAVTYGGLLVFGGVNVWWNLAAFIVSAACLVGDAVVFAIVAYTLRDRLFKLAASSLFIMVISDMAAFLWPTNAYLPLLTVASAFFVVVSTSLSALDNAYSKTMHFMNQKIEEVRQELAAQTENIEDVVISLARTIDAKDKYTEGHTERVSQYAVFLGERLGLSDRNLETLRIGALIHDLGKIGIDLNILNKPGQLTEEEFEQIRQHPALGQQICSPLKALQEVGDIIRHHHEKLDGSGYPDGLRGDHISQNARMVAIVDIFDALTTERSYRAALTVEEALRIMKEEAAQGKLDSYLLKEFEAMLVELGVA